MTHYVHDAMKDFWGGPKFTDSPLMQLQPSESSFDISPAVRGDVLVPVVSSGEPLVGAPSSPLLSLPVDPPVLSGAAVPT